ncbi:DUF3040 domain-containing protein [Actinocorallia sp. A-T 12471]|uniref:DUF3040 domain-containing protein n=1 Tax=Actinocorallia sp. A-T 12471 TaxID=3089813 RepID=UPI0029CD4DA0|nr:DUF3040 domain-containing protein [Actinocorallia sp. A-T 12471]MDX6741248.1 DUF3040 domain-containing protein [Actinocorallia sp. A-T 12471]
MALSMDEERILTEIASRLSREDPALAQRLERFGRARRTRARRIAAAVVIAVLGLVSAVGTAIAVFFT